MKKLLGIFCCAVVVTYLFFLVIISIPYTSLIDFDCDRFRRIDYVFPARQLNCWLGADIEGEK